MKEYSIKKSQKPGENYTTMIIINSDGDEIAEYRLDIGSEKAQIANMRRAINRHLADGGTLGNYNW